MEQNYNDNALDLFRILGTAQVFLGHVITHFAMAHPMVNVIYFIRGVPILFVLCGFLAAKSLDAHSTKSWLLRRAVRILPAFWACIIVNSIIIFLAYDQTPTAKEGLIYAVTQFLGLNFYTGDWLRGYGVGTPNGVLWTITVQVQFFVIAPIIHRIMKNASGRAWALLAAGLTACSIFCRRIEAYIPEILGKLINVTVAPYLYFLVLGMMAWYCRDKLLPILKKYRFAILAGYVLWKLAEIYWQFPHVLDGVLYNTVTTILMAGLIFAFAFCGKFRMKHDYTYGFYLYHMVFINLAVEFGYDAFPTFGTGAVIMAVVVGLTTAGAGLSYHLVESPANALAARRVGNV